MRDLFNKKSKNTKRRSGVALGIILSYKTPLTVLILGALYVTFLLVIHDYTYGDFQIFVKQEVKASYFIDIWSHWSSRLLIEGAVNILSKNILIWQVLTIIFGSVLFWSLARILKITRIWQAIVLFTVVLLINSQILATAGIFATTINYLWPLACLGFVFAVTLYPPGTKAKRLVSAIFVWPLVIFAACSEQVSVLGLLLFFGYIFYLLFDKRRVSVQAWIICLMFALGIINALISPGNDARTAAETINWWPTFAHMSALDKLIAGSVVTFSRIFLAPEVPAILLVVGLAVMSWTKRNLRAFIAILPTVAILTLFFAPNTTGMPGTYIRQINYFNELRAEALYLSPDNYETSGTIYLLLFFIIMLSISLAVYFLYGSTKKTLFLLFMLLIGFGVSLLVSFSPTLFASSTRTLFPLLIIIASIDFVILSDIIKLHFKQLSKREKLGTGL